MNELQGQISEIQFYNKLQNIMSQIENNMNIVNNLFDNLQNAIIFAQLNKVHPFCLR